MKMRRLGKSGIEIAPLVLGCNVFGWTIDEAESFKVLDAFVDLGFNAIDTADVYSSWAPGNSGGESETIIGRWLAQNPSKRDKVVVFTKVGSEMKGKTEKDLSAKWIYEAVEDSLSRLGTEQIDVYFSHWPDKRVTHEETLGAYDTLIRDGKVRAIGASNYDAQHLADALSVSREKNLPAYSVVQPEYNLYARSAFDGPLAELCKAEDLGVVTYFSLASGFLTGKYRSEADSSKSVRGGGMGKYLNSRGLAILDALDEVGDRHGAKPAEIALAWIMARDGVTAPIASATSTSQVETLAKAASLDLDRDDMDRLDAASA